jgi:hypothetical protein
MKKIEVTKKTIFLFKKTQRSTQAKKETFTDEFFTWTV